MKHWRRKLYIYRERESFVRRVEVLGKRGTHCTDFQSIFASPKPVRSNMSVMRSLGCYIGDDEQLKDVWCVKGMAYYHEVS